MKILDLHEDIGMLLKYTDNTIQNDVLPNYKNGGIKFSIMACCFEGNNTYEEMITDVKRVFYQLKSSDIYQVKSAEDLEYEHDQLAMLSLEGMSGIDSEIETRIDELYDYGVRMVSLCWNDCNALASGSDDFERGLTDLGKQVVHYLNKKHIIIDVSHANDLTFWDILRESECPVVATHSNSRKLRNVSRNLTDEQLNALRGKNALVGINAVQKFLDDKDEGIDLDAMVEHLRHISRLIGIENLALGFDFSEFYKFGFERDDIDANFDCSKAYLFAEAMKKHGYSEEEIEMVCYKNAYNFIKNNI